MKVNYVKICKSLSSNLSIAPLKIVASFLLKVAKNWHCAKQSFKTGFTKAHTHTHTSMHAHTHAHMYAGLRRLKGSHVSCMQKHQSMWAPIMFFTSRGHSRARGTRPTEDGKGMNIPFSDYVQHVARLRDHKFIYLWLLPHVYLHYFLIRVFHLIKIVIFDLRDWIKRETTSWAHCPKIVKSI